MNLCPTAVSTADGHVLRVGTAHADPSALPGQHAAAASSVDSPAWLDGAGQVLTPVEAAQRLGVARSRIYALVRQGQLDDVGGETLRVTAASVERRLAARPPTGEPIGALGAWAILALASHDAAFRTHVAGRLSDSDRSRAKIRLEERSLIHLAPRLRARAVVRHFDASGEALVALMEDPRGVLAGASAARRLDWPVPDGDWPVELYIAETDLVELMETQALELADDGQGDLVLRAVPEPWPFPPHMRVVPDVVAALDLVEVVPADLAALGRAQLEELAPGVEPSWQRRPQRRRPLRPVVPSGRHASRSRQLLQGGVNDQVWDDQAERDACGLVALLFVAGTAQRRTAVSEALRVSPGRLERACAFLRASPPHGLLLVEDADHLELASAPDCTAVVERFLDIPSPEPLSQAALDVLSIVAYEQPVTRADISHIRGTDSSGVIDTLLARGLIADDPRFGGRGRPSFLVTTAAFLQLLGLGSLAELPPRPTVSV